MAGKCLRLTGSNDRVRVVEGDDETVTVELGDGIDGVTLVGSRYDVYRLILEADKQLARLSYPRT